MAVPVSGCPLLIGPTESFERAPTSTRDWPVHAPVHVEAQGPDLDRWLPENGRAAERSGQAGLPGSRAHAPARLRYALANDGIDTRTIQAYLGHKDIRHTVRYTELSPMRFKALWRD